MGVMGVTSENYVIDIGAGGSVGLVRKKGKKRTGLKLQIAVLPRQQTLSF